jgi:hypothetical protein
MRRLPRPDALSIMILVLVLAAAMFSYRENHERSILAKSISASDARARSLLQQTSQAEATQQLAPLAETLETGDWMASMVSRVLVICSKSGATLRASRSTLPTAASGPLIIDIVGRGTFEAEIAGTRAAVVEALRLIEATNLPWRIETVGLSQDERQGSVLRVSGTVYYRTVNPNRGL